MNINKTDLSILSVNHLLIGDQVPSKDVQSTVSDLEMRMRSCQTILNSIRPLLNSTPSRRVEFNASKVTSNPPNIEKITSLYRTVTIYMVSCQNEIILLSRQEQVQADRMQSTKLNLGIQKSMKAAQEEAESARKAVIAAYEAIRHEPNPNQVGRFIGIRNVVNSCYMNAALQPLFGIPGISERVSEQLARALASKDRDTAEAEANLQSSIESFTVFNTNPDDVQKYIKIEKTIKDLVEKNKKEASKREPLSETIRSKKHEIMIAPEKEFSLIVINEIII